MNKKLFVSLVVLSSLVGCRNEISAGDSANITQVQNEDNSYSVVYVNKDNVSHDVARQTALTRAAEITVQNGCRYFVVDSESDATVATYDRQDYPDNNRFPGNMYEELIVEKGFDRRSLENNTPQAPQYYPAYKVVFHCVTGDHPRKALDACDFTACTK